ncbi:hypothetical protein PSQ20_21240 [Curvibacter sp. RS43]|uniref:hypothetical protein n=1 Tax=Curvibacter microcysteis TaxID=3026419 RepID=UPI00235F8875|nr:hypothetical protein [Curvibacter sp. RS43]MDD0812877.1 hypothetical protein [Curvibacter sp. RS43]
MLGNPLSAIFRMSGSKRERSVEVKATALILLVACPNLSAMMRPSTSVATPGGNRTTSGTGRVGNVPSVATEGMLTIDRTESNDTPAKIETNFTGTTAQRMYTKKWRAVHECCTVILHGTFHECMR